MKMHDLNCINAIPFFNSKFFVSGTENSKRYFVATQDRELRNELHKIPGTCTCNSRAKG